MKIVKLLYESGIRIEAISKTTEMKQNNKKVDLSQCY